MSTNTIAIVRKIAQLRAAIWTWRIKGERVGLVPTMGALHDGHLALVAAACADCDRVVATIFVNPTQFGPNEDFAAYPRDEAADLRRLADADCDLVFAPSVDEMYPAGFATAVSVSGLTEGLCGPYRPGHFEGVATIVTKLLNQAGADRAYFGEKDYQQLQVIKRLARDLDIGTDIVGVPTMREADGLAMSSRNAYLNERERAIAPALYRTLCEAAAAFSGGRATGSEAGAAARRELINAGFDSVDYVEICDAATLQPLEHAERPARVLAAARLGRARLIDNVAVA